MTQRTPPENGYGYVIQSVMRNPKISKIAKAILCVIAVFADPTTWEAHPSTKMICSILKLSPATFRKHRQELVSIGYISFKREGNKIVYMLWINETMVRGNGYGFIPKSVMLDSTLSRNTRVFYCYLASFAGMRGIAFPIIQTILSELGLSLATMYKCRKELEERGLLKVQHRMNDDKSKYLPNIYTLTENKRIFGGEQLSDDFYAPEGIPPINYYQLVYDNIEPFPQQAEKLEEYGNQQDWDLVNYAIWQARRRKKPFNYFKAIMDKFEVMGVESIEEARELKSEFWRLGGTYGDYF